MHICSNPCSFFFDGLLLLKRDLLDQQIAEMIGQDRTTLAKGQGLREIERLIARRDNDDRGDDGAEQPHHTLQHRLGTELQRGFGNAHPGRFAAAEHDASSGSGIPGSEGPGYTTRVRSHRTLC